MKEQSTDQLTYSVNFAFAYIDPDSYQIVTMDSDTPSSLFTDATNLKSIKEDIKVFVSVGGWSFSDNDTTTQRIYGDTYCGTGCVSNCDAAAQCGKDAATYNATCPLNVCCSQYGFVSSRPKTSLKTGC